MLFDDQDMPLPPGAKLVQQPPAGTLPPGALIVEAPGNDEQFRLTGGFAPADRTALERLPDARLDVRDVPLFNKDGQIKPVAQTPGQDEMPWIVRKPLEYLGEGMTQLGKGLHDLRRPQSLEQTAGALSDVIRGGLTTATPFFAPEMAARPLATALGFGTFGAAQGAAEFGAEQLGIPDGYRRLLGDLVGMYGGNKVHSWLSGVSRIPRMKEGDAIYRQLEAAVERMKDPNLTAQQRYALRAMTEGLLNGLREAEGLQVFPRLFPNPNRLERDAYNYLRKDVGGSPNAGAATGSPFVRGATWLTGMTPAGAVMDVKSKGKTTEAIRRRADAIVAEAMPEEGPASDHYSDFRQYEQVARPQTVDFRVDKDGSVIQGDLKFPVDVRDLKYDLQPIFDDMSWMPAADRNTSAAYTAVKKILEGPDHITASQAEIGLGLLKKAARENEGRLGGITKYIIPKLQQAIDGTVSQYGGDDAVRSLRTGRLAAAKEAGANWLADQFGKAQQAGGFDREQGLWHAWTSLKPGAKASMFNDQQIAELDKFFLGVRMLAQNPNPSGTALVGALSGQAGVAAGGGIVNPMFWLGQLGAAGLSKFLRTDTGIKLLTDGLRIPRNTERGRFIERKIRKILGDEPGGQPPEQGPPAGGGGQPGDQPPSLLNRVRERIGEMFASEEGSVPARRPRDPIAAVALRFLMENPLKIEGTGEGGLIKTVDLAQSIRKTARSGGGSLNPRSEARIRQQRAEMAMIDDLEYALLSQPEARKWYTGSVQEMEQELIANRPEFQDAAKRSLFKYLLGVTSNGVDPETNFDAAVRGWDLYKEHGRFMAYDPARKSELSNSGQVGLTFRANSYETAMKRLDQLVQEKGEAGAVEWLQNKQSIEELKKYDPKITVGDGSPRLGSYVLGEKVGAFGANLNGIYSELTADKWWSRTWNRWMGTNIATDQEGKFKFGKEGDPLVQDDPRNETERNLMRSAAENVAKKLDLTVAELQAVLWYAEQALYRAHGIPASSVDYSTAAKKFFSKPRKGAAIEAAPTRGPGAVP